MRIGKHQESILVFLYQDVLEIGTCDIRSFVEYTGLGNLDVIYPLEYDEDPDDIKATQLLIEKRRNLYFTIWNTVKLLEKAGLIEVSERKYQWFRNIKLTEAGRDMVESRHPEFKEEKRLKRCGKCKFWRKERLKVERNEFTDNPWEEKKADEIGCAYRHDDFRNCGYFLDKDFRMP